MLGLVMVMMVMMCDGRAPWGDIMGKRMWAMSEARRLRRASVRAGVVADDNDSNDDDEEDEDEEDKDEEDDEEEEEDEGDEGTSSGCSRARTARPQSTRARK